ncbi:MAG: carbohydrate ABC transporter permease [Anaerolineae bacterium]|nr:carbohydrate ABC transporter permease [Anaerolineae bacterium]
MSTNPIRINLRPMHRFKWERLLLNMVLLAAGLIMIFPLLWAVMTSFKPSIEIVSHTPSILPQTWTLENYVKIPNIAPFARFFFNSLIISGVSTIFVVAGSVTAGYVFAKYHFRGRDVLLLLVIATIIIPMESYVIPLFLTINTFGWVNSYAGIIYPTIIMSTGIFFLRQSIVSVPDELIAAARIDGCSEFGVLRHVIFPTSSSAIAAIAIVNWVFTWGLFLWPLIVASSANMFTMEIGLMYFQREYIVDYGGTMAATVVTMIPIVIFFLIFRRRIIEGIATTGMKGV